MKNRTNLSEPMSIAQILDRAGRLLAPVLKCILGILLLQIGFCALQAASEAGLISPNYKKLLGMLVGIMEFVIFYVTVPIAARQWLGDNVTYADIRPKLSLGRGIKFLFMNMAIGITAMLCMIPFIIPGLIYLANRLFASYIYLIEDTTADEAIKKSKFLMTREKWYSLSGAYVRLFAISIIIVTINVMAAGIALSGVDVPYLGVAVTNVVLACIGKVLELIAQVYGNLAYIGLYYDLRSRYEAADILAELNDI